MKRPHQPTYRTGDARSLRGPCRRRHLEQRHARQSLVGEAAFVRVDAHRPGHGQRRDLSHGREHIRLAHDAGRVAALDAPHHEVAVGEIGDMIGAATERAHAGHDRHSAGPSQPRRSRAGP
jgi:hypothetical protein